MDTAAWDHSLLDLAAHDVDRNVGAAKRLYDESTMEDVPRLLTLLQEGSDFFVREAAAGPLAALAAPSVVHELLIGYQRGFEEGHDNDGFTAALIEGASLFPTEMKEALNGIIASAEEPIRGHALWLIDFCEGRAH
jgi:hypothetical protein